jgi:hypothetical protein
MKIIVYTHTDVDWVTNFWFLQTKKYFKDFEKIIFINDSNSVGDTSYKVIEYDDKLIYRKRVLSCLEKLNDDDVVMFNHEDMFLYDFPNYEKLNEMVSLVKSGSVDLIKLLRNGNTLNKYENYEYLFYNYNGFSIQPTITKVKTLKKIFSEIDGDTIWSFESNSMDVVNNWGLVNLFIYDNKPKRGLNHWDSGIYPYVATAVVKGKWNDEYKMELDNIKKSYEN